MRKRRRQATASEQAAVKTDYAQLANVDEFRAYLAKLPAKAPIAIWLNLEPGEREAEGFGSRVASIEVSSKAGEGRSIWMDEKGEALAGAGAADRRCEAAEDRARSETAADRGRAREKYSACHSNLFLSVAADDRALTISPMS